MGFPQGKQGQEWGTEGTMWTAQRKSGLGVVREAERGPLLIGHPYALEG